MLASEFKSSLKKIKENLRGLNIQFITQNSVRPYRSLNEFGNAVLEQEKRGNDFRINMAWTNEGTININSFEQLVELFRTKKLSCVTFEAFYNPKDLGDYMRHGYSLND
jgi:hypothetical protein